MNFLCHAFLGADRAGDRLGGFLGDFVKGPLTPGKDGLPAAVLAGVELHRRIDSFADGHPAFHRSRERVSPGRRRVAGVMVDLFYDHFLAREWTALAVPLGLPASLPAFTAALYAEAAALGPALPPRLGEILASMAAEDWLASYREADTVAYALDRMSRRFTRPSARAALCGSGAELPLDYAGFAADFRAFLPDALAFARAWQSRRR